MLAYFASWGASIHISSSTQAQWIIPNSMHLMFSAIVFVLSFFALESPRWLIKVGKPEQAAQTLAKLRQLPIEHPYVQTELMDVKNQLGREREATVDASRFGILRELVAVPANRYRLMLSIFSQLLSQWSGANSITIYAPEYFEMMGTSGQNEKLFATAIFGLVKFISAVLCALFLIDFIGRKRALSIGILLQFFSMLYMALFLTIDKNVADEPSTQSPSQKRAATTAIVMIYISGFGWALGWNSYQYVINAEIYPLRLRALGGSIAMTFHFVNQVSAEIEGACTNAEADRDCVVWQLESCATHVHRPHDGWHHVVLLSGYPHWSVLDVFLRPRNCRPKSGSDGRAV